MTKMAARGRPCTLLGLAALVAMPVHADDITAKQAEVTNRLLAIYANQAKNESQYVRSRGAKAWEGPFSAKAGRVFYLERRTYQSTEYTCFRCHADDPIREGKDMGAKKPIKPLAPSANPDRFTDVEKVERSFKECCFDVHGRDCHAYEKGNLIAYLLSAK